MSVTPRYQPHLRLAPSDQTISTEQWRNEQQRCQQIARENRTAAIAAPVQSDRLASNDPRWVLAVRAYSQLQGTTLPPERRERVLRTARQLGVRIFDASLIIAIVQDHARTGRTLGDAQPVLSLITPQARAQRSAWRKWVGAIIMAVLANAILIWWLTSAIGQSD